MHSPGLTNLNALQRAALIDLFTQAADMLSEDDRGFDRKGGGEHQHCSACKVGLLEGQGQHGDDCKIARLVENMRRHAAFLKQIGP